MRQPTLQDLADEFGVARSTVSRALRDDPQISDATRARIQRRARAIGYLPNAAARSLYQRSSGVIGLVLPRTAPFVFSNAYFSELFEGVASAAEKAGYPVLVSSSPAPDYPRWLREARVDALIALGDALSAEQIHELESLSDRGAHVALIGAARTETRLPLMVCDEGPGLTAMAHAARAHGHREAAIIAGPRDARYARLRNAMWRRALRAHGIEVTTLLHGDDTSEGGADAAASLLRTSSATLWCCGNDQMAFGALQALAEHGLEAPRDVSVVGFDDVRGAALIGLASIRQPTQALGACAVATVVAKIHGQEPSCPRFDTSFSPRRSLGPAAQRWKED